MEHGRNKEEQGHPHASSPVSVWQRGWVPCQGGRRTLWPSAASSVSSPQGQFDGHAQDPRECPVPQPQQPEVASPRAEESGDSRDGDQAHRAVTECCLHPRHRQGLSLQQRDRGSALDLKGAPCAPQLHVGRAGQSTGHWHTAGTAPGRRPILCGQTCCTRGAATPWAASAGAELINVSEIAQAAVIALGGPGAGQCCCGCPAALVISTVSSAMWVP